MQSEFIDSSRDSYPLRGDVTFLNSFPAELSLKPYNEPLNSLFLQQGIDEQVKEWHAQNYPCDEDAYVLSSWQKSKVTNSRESKPSYTPISAGRTFLGRLICIFHGFREEHFDNPTLPT
jgi:hypothetical protein